MFRSIYKKNVSSKDIKEKRNNKCIHFSTILTKTHCPNNIPNYLTDSVLPKYLTFNKLLNIFLLN